MSNKPHWQVTLGGSLAGVFVFIIGLMSLDTVYQLANFGLYISTAIVFFSVSVILLILSTTSKNTSVKRDKWAIRCFFVGFLVLATTTIGSIMYAFLAFNNSEAVLVMTGFIPIFVTGYLLGNWLPIKKV